MPARLLPIRRLGKRRRSRPSTSLRTNCPSAPLRTGCTPDGPSRAQSSPEPKMPPKALSHSKGSALEDIRLWTFAATVFRCSFGVRDHQQIKRRLRGRRRQFRLRRGRPWRWRRALSRPSRLNPPRFRPMRQFPLLCRRGQGFRERCRRERCIRERSRPARATRGLRHLWR